MSLSQTKAQDLQDTVAPDNSAEPLSQASPAPLLVQERQMEIPYTTETVELYASQRRKENIYFVVTFPTATTIRSITPRFKESPVKITQQLVSIYGSTEGFVISDDMSLPAGDYCIILVCSDKKDTKEILGIGLQITYGNISPFILSQVLFSLSRSLGFEPSHIMNYPSRTLNPPTPFYRKLRSEINKTQNAIGTVQEELKKYEQLISLVSQISVTIGELSTHIHEMGRSNALYQEQMKTTLAEIEAIKGKMEEMQQTLIASQSQEKGGETQTITVADLEKLITERKRFYEKLVEAEDYIESLNI